jgi:hypothetical protein
MEAAQRGVPVGATEIDAAIDAVTSAGRFSPTQGAALKGHTCPLHGDSGAQTIAAVVSEVMPDLREHVSKRHVIQMTGWAVREPGRKHPFKQSRRCPCPVPGQVVQAPPYSFLPP